MTFKPFSEQYDFNEAPLVEDFPNYFYEPILSWLVKVLSSFRFDALDKYAGDNYLIKREFKNVLQITFRRGIPDWLSELLTITIKDPDYLCNLLSYILQRNIINSHATELEHILRIGGSAYKVHTVENNGNQQFELVRRVPSVVEAASQNALSANELLMNAWIACFSHNPNYAEAVRKSNDFIEGYLTNKFWPSEKRTKSIFNILHEINKNPELLSFKGDSFLKDKTRLIAMLEGISKIRGEHTMGEGRMPTSEEAEYILHTTIYIWNLMEK